MHVKNKSNDSMGICRSKASDCWFSGSFGISAIIISIFVPYKQNCKNQIAFYSCVQMELNFRTLFWFKLSDAPLELKHSFFCKEVITFYDAFTSECFATWKYTFNCCYFIDRRHDFKLCILLELLTLILMKVISICINCTYFLSQWSKLFSSHE